MAGRGAGRNSQGFASRFSGFAKLKRVREDSRKSILDHADESDGAVFHQVGMIAPCGPGRQPALHAVCHRNATTRVENPADDRGKEPGRERSAREPGRSGGPDRFTAVQRTSPAVKIVSEMSLPSRSHSRAGRRRACLATSSRGASRPKDTNASRGCGNVNSWDRSFIRMQVARSSLNVARQAHRKHCRA